MEHWVSLMKKMHFCSLQNQNYSLQAVLQILVSLREIAIKLEIYFESKWKSKIMPTLPKQRFSVILIEKSQVCPKYMYIFLYKSHSPEIYK